MSNYYENKLNSQSLFRVYETELPRIKQYLECEIGFVREKLSEADNVLEIGAGYGRIMKELSPYCKTILGMDISAENVELGREYLKDCPNASMITMDANDMDFDAHFDVILCLQNGLSAMRADDDVIKSMVKLLAPGGTLYISSYNAKFWDWRLKWFEEQAAKGLVGEIDYEKTKDGVIVCNDGFRATTYTPEELDEIGHKIGLPFYIEEVNQSSIFLVVKNMKEDLQ